MANGRDEGTLKRIGHEIAQEARRQVRGFPAREVRRQLGGFRREIPRQLGGFGSELRRQIFGGSGRRKPHKRG